MDILHRLQACQDAAVNSLEQHQRQWSAAVTSQDGRLGQLNTQLEELEGKIRESEGTAQNMDEQHRQLASLAQQLTSAKADLANTQRSGILITHDHELEGARLKTLESDLNERYEALNEQSKEQARWQARQEARFTALEEGRRTRKEDLVRREQGMAICERVAESSWTSREIDLTA